MITYGSKTDHPKKGRFYDWKGKKLPSVTNILESGVPKPALAAWKARLVADTAAHERVRLATLNKKQTSEYLLGLANASKDSASALGSQLHQYAERQANGISEDPTVPVDPELVPFMVQYRQFVSDFKPEYIETETTVVSRTYGYAGTLDGIIRFHGKTYIMDIKTGKSIWPEVALQLAAYRNADFIARPDGREDIFPEVESRALVLHVRPDTYDLRYIQCDSGIFDTFLSALDLYHFLTDYGKYVIGGSLKDTAG